MIAKTEGLAKYLVDKAKEFGGDCKKVFVAVSGGIDSATVIAILCKAYGPKNVFGMYRDIRSNPKHLEDVKLLHNVFDFNLLCVDANTLYDNFLIQAKRELEKNGVEWFDEGTDEAIKSGASEAFSSTKSCMTVFMSDFFAKYVDSGKGRLFGTGNGEEDGLLRYFNKRGDGAVDNNILSGLTKAEVRQLARYLGVPECIICKKPSADLEANGDAHNDEDQLTSWAKRLGYNIKISYGAPDGFTEGNIAWAWKENIDWGVITGDCRYKDGSELGSLFKYSDEQLQTIFFLRKIEMQTRHKVEPIPGVDRRELLELGLVH